MLEPTRYARHDRFTDPGEYADFLNTLPRNRADLSAAINGFLIHLWKIRKYHPEQLTQRPHDVFTRRIESVLARVKELDSRPLDQSRPEARRAIVDCRTFSLMLVAVLRQRGIPARARCGFATYLEKTHYQDHWVCEYWDETQKRWVMEDPDLRKPDVSPEEFLNASRVWAMRETKPEILKKCGWGPGMLGQWAVRLDLIHDLAALNEFVAVSGDGWGLGNKKETAITPEDLTLLDRAAALVNADRLDDLATLYHSASGLKPPATIRHFDYVKEMKTREVAWEKE